MSTGTLYVVATPIGNLEDVSRRAVRVLAEAAYVVCEDTRTTRKLLERHSIHVRLVSCHAHNEAMRAREVVADLGAGRDVALVTDAGTPVVSDPGSRVIEAAIAAGVRVVPVPGASAALAALSAAGLPAGRFTFFGFAPRKQGERQAFLRDVIESEATAILYEAPHRIARTLGDLAELEPQRRASLHREMTKVHEETLRGALAELAEAVAARPPRGEFTLVVAGREALPRSGSIERAVALGQALVQAGRSARDAAREAAAREGVSRREVYGALVRGGDSSG